ncbi:MAG TPA: hypothetical protein VF940_07575 [Streptosporangiaceae bacterium]
MVTGGGSGMGRERPAGSERSPALAAMGALTPRETEALRLVADRGRRARAARRFRPQHQLD